MIDSSLATLDETWVRCSTCICDQHDTDTFDYIQLIHFCNFYICRRVSVMLVSMFHRLIWKYRKKELSIAKWILYGWLYSTD